MRFRIGQKFEYTDWITKKQVVIEIIKISDNKVVCNTISPKTDNSGDTFNTYEINTDSEGNEFFTVCKDNGNFLQIHAVP